MMTLSNVHDSLTCSFCSPDCSKDVLIEIKTDSEFNNEPYAP